MSSPRVVGIFGGRGSTLSRMDIADGVFSCEMKGGCMRLDGDGTEMRGTAIIGCVLRCKPVGGRYSGLGGMDIIDGVLRCAKVGGCWMVVSEPRNVWLFGLLTKTGRRYMVVSGA